MDEGVRKVLHANHGAKMLLHHVLREKKELLPEYDPDAGFHFPLVKQYIGSSLSEAQHLIGKRTIGIVVNTANRFPGNWTTQVGSF